MVAVRMVSEGVDVPRLAVGVYATSTATPLFFAQAVGRFVRARRRGETASVFLPSVPMLLQHAAEMEVERDHALDRRPATTRTTSSRRRTRCWRRPTGPQDEARPSDELAFEALEAEATLRPGALRRRRVRHAGRRRVSDEEQDFLGLPGLLEPDQVATLLLQHRQAQQVAHSRRRRTPAAAGRPPTGGRPHRAAAGAAQGAQRPGRRLAPPHRHAARRHPHRAAAGLRRAAGGAGERGAAAGAHRPDQGVGAASPLTGRRSRHRRRPAAAARRPASSYDREGLVQAGQREHLRRTVRPTPARTSEPPARSARRWIDSSTFRPVESMNVTPVRSSTTCGRDVLHGGQDVVAQLRCGLEVDLAADRDDGAARWSWTRRQVQIHDRSSFGARQGGGSAGRLDRPAVAGYILGFSPGASTPGYQQPVTVAASRSTARRVVSVEGTWLSRNENSFDLAVRPAGEPGQRDHAGQRAGLGLDQPGRAPWSGW